MIAEAERIDGELTRLRRDERIALQRSRLAEPTRPAPVFTPAQRSATAATRDPEPEAMRIWLRSHTEDADRAPDAVRQAAECGFHVGSMSARFRAADLVTINRAKLRTLSTGGVGTGAEVVPAKTYSTKVLEYISHFSAFLALLDSEVTADGVKRTYFTIDDTSLMSSYITASSGTESTIIFVPVMRSYSTSPAGTTRSPARSSATPPSRSWTRSPRRSGTATAAGSRVTSSTAPAPASPG